LSIANPQGERGGGERRYDPPGPEDAPVASEALEVPREELPRGHFGDEYRDDADDRDRADSDEERQRGAALPEPEGGDGEREEQHRRIGEER
jgi:hypothetical protein